MAEVSRWPTQAKNRSVSEPTYGSFTPYFMIDSEYLKSLISGKESNGCELVESASLQNVPGIHFPVSIKHSDSGPESGIFSPLGGSIQSSLRTSYTPEFFHECDIQLSKLLTFMEFHLSKIESQVNIVRRIENKDSVHNPSRKGNTDTKDEKELSDDSGVCDNESKHLLVTLDDEDQPQASLTLLTRLREVLVSIQKSLASSFAALDALVGMHDHHNDSQKGRAYLERKLPRKEEYEKRLETCMENLDHEMNRLYRKQDLNINGHDCVRDRTESKVNTDIRQSPTSCVTYFHALLFLVTICLIAYMYKSDYTLKWTVYLRLLRGPFLIIFFLYLYGTNIKVWALKHIDYVNIFNHHPKGTPKPNYVYNVAGMFCVFFTILVITLMISSPFTDEVPGKIVPLIMWLSLILFLANPFKILLRQGRFNLLLVFVRILLAPFTFVYFGDFWFADQLNSTVAILLDIQYMTCYMIADPWYGNVDTSVCTSSGNGIRPVISCLPALWRLLQCLRCYYDTRNIEHLLNALKYFTTFPVVVFATMFATKVPRTFVIWKLDLDEVGWILILLLISSFIHAVYTFIWDIYCDWGLWDFGRGTYFRTTLVYKHRLIYLAAMLVDLVLRFAWALKISLAIVWHLDSDLIYTGLIIAEIVRRFIWNFFRVEFAHVLETQHKD